jgi:hypothetical protein
MITSAVIALAVMLLVAGGEIGRPFWRGVFEVAVLWALIVVLMEVNEWPDLWNL